MFQPIAADLNFVSLEETELARWRDLDIFHRSVAQREGAEPWVFYEGPPTANGKPGLRSEEHRLNSSHVSESRMPSSA